ncbi:hypothetical protein RIF29_08106 [Crotalaria pallida]|uniref:Uncharacterized protein n=1 Tax=Crotalaria pallida TaxID=3830 RepID=A0AAN9J550_CROPI
MIHHLALYGGVMLECELCKWMDDAVCQIVIPTCCKREKSQYILNNSASFSARSQYISNRITVTIIKLATPSHLLNVDSSHCVFVELHSPDKSP